MIRRSLPYFTAGIKLDPDAQAYLTAANIVAGTIYNPIDKPLDGSVLISGINEFFVELKDLNYYTRLLYLYLYLGNLSSEKRVNAITPGTKDAIELGDEACTYNYLGLNPNINLPGAGKRSYLSTQVKASELPTFDCCLGAYISDFEAGNYDIGVFNGNGLAIGVGGNVIARGGNITVTPSYDNTIEGANGLNLLTIQSSSKYSLFNKNDKKAGGTPGTNTLALDIYIGAMNSGFFARNYHGASFMGRSFSDVEAPILSGVFEKLMLKLRRGATNRMTCRGDSITLGVAASDTNHRWTTIVSDSLLLTEQNGGVANTTMADLDANKTTLIPQKCAYDKYLFIGYFTNDIAEDAGTAAYETHFNSVLDYAINTKGWLRDDICITLAYYYGTLYSQGLIDSYVNAGLSVANTWGIQRVLNLNPIMASNGGTALLAGGSGVHPNDTGMLVCGNAWISFLDSF